MPNQPHATTARASAATFAPQTPKLARASTGNGTPYFVPACAFNKIASSTITLPISTSRHACHQLRPWSIMLLAIV